MPKYELAVVESRWERKRNYSIRSIFDLISDLSYGDTHGYHYEMVNDEHAFKEIVSRLRQTRGIRALYIAAHGIRDGIRASNGNLIAKRLIFRTLTRRLADESGSLDGVHFGACWFLDQRHAFNLLRRHGVGEPGLWWVAGYSKVIDWIDSSALDMFFWQQYLNDERGTALERINRCADAIRRLMPGANKEMGFEIYTRSTRGRVKGLLANEHLPVTGANGAVNGNGHARLNARIGSRINGNGRLPPNGRFSGNGRVAGGLRINGSSGRH
jgi:hypothetical protein